MMVSKRRWYFFLVFYWFFGVFWVFLGFLLVFWGFFEVFSSEYVVVDWLFMVDYKIRKLSYQAQH